MMSPVYMCKSHSISGIGCHDLIQCSLALSNIVIIGVDIYTLNASEGLSA